MKPFIDRRTLKHIDLALLIILFFILICGLTCLYSATHLQNNIAYELIFKKQLIWICIGIIVLFTLSFFNYTSISRYSYLIYFLCIILLVAVIFMGKHVQGARRWISIAGFTIQPTEFTKLAIIMCLSKFISSKFDLSQKNLSYGVTFLAMAIILIPALLIFIEPDLGSAVVVVLIGFSMLVLNKMKLRVLLILILLVGISSPLIWGHLKDYQKARIKTFLNPNLDPTGAGYHINQSKIAIGSGEIMGKGFMKGTQTRLQYLPEHYTDFIFSHLAEEWGFVGSLTLIGLYTLLILRCVNIGLKSKDLLGYNLSIGTALLFFWHSAINLGMVIGLLPVVGVPLILVSYGGSSVLTAMASLGLSLNVAMRRFLYR
ncbi:MAG: rod shape-determining protein RodA [Desulfatiglandales bacterium]